MRGICCLSTVVLSMCLLGLTGCDEHPEAMVLVPAPEPVHPAVFAHTTFEEATSPTAGCGDQLLLVDAVTSWCCPCKEMDKTTWQDERVVAWINEHGMAIKVNTEDCPEFRQEYSVHSWPTFLVFKDGEEIARDVGFKSADEMLEWLNGLPEA